MNEKDEIKDLLSRLDDVAENQKIKTPEEEKQQFWDVLAMEAEEIEALNDTIPWPKSALNSWEVSDDVKEFAKNIKNE